MATLIDATDLSAPELDAALAPAAAALRAGELVAMPTETVYGLGAHALDPVAVRRIFTAKGRPANNPLIVHVHDIARARALSPAWDERAEALAQAFWPGPLTLVLPRSAEVPDEVTAGLDTVGVRVPAHPVALALLRLADVPVAAPSANLYTRVSPTRAEHVLDGLGDRVAFVVDGGPTDVGVESTVLSLATPTPTILRPGMITLDAIARVLPDVAYRASGELAEGEVASSPGLARKHYSPRAQVVLADPADAEAVAAEIRARAEKNERFRGLMKQVLTPYDLLPTNQPPKLEMLAELRDKLERLPSKVMDNNEDFSTFYAEVKQVTERGEITTATLPLSLIHI